MALTLANSLLDAPILGRGLLSPLTTDPATGDFVRVSGIDNVKACVIDLIETRIGDRVMNEDLGTDLPTLLFEDPTGLVDVLPSKIQEAILRFEPRVTNVQVRVRQPDLTTVAVDVNWEIRSSGLRDSLVYPFYTQATGAVASDS